ncbi:class I SAM-dependent methyltransferase [Nocardia amamiensis]|uniref:Class I SAM-dependent methyltransferase n=1 Tax=Nocardia amamiensis TaxID=404578 RepID=A0ABS0CW44_9NOCA|nr:class I SAM-dependent methyltransferase [Nocardia amamiensis]MBF6299069.1 class I SAM-dependent methyltransferase [Nocardia amamiensis]
MVDAVYEEARFASLYDVLNPWQPCYEFYRKKMMVADSVLDIGCGTGKVLAEARRSGHRGRLVGADPAAAMLTIARAKTDEVEWLCSDVQRLPTNDRFDLVVMTGHAFQLLLTDDDIRAALDAIRQVLGPSGQFIFEVRNPVVRGWEQWTDRNTRRTVSAPDGGVVEVVYIFERQRPPDLVDYETAFRFHDVGESYSVSSTLRFINPTRLCEILTATGFEIVRQEGDWSGAPWTSASPEVIMTTCLSAD